jgi:hypothetical protein
MPTFVKATTSGGAATVTDQLAGTAVAFAGPKGIVRAAFGSTLTTTTALLKGRNSGKEIIPNGSAPCVIGPITAQVLDGPTFIFEGVVTPGEPLELTIVKNGTETYMIGVRTE